MGQRGRCRGWRRGKPTLTPPFEAFRGSLGTRVHLCRPRDPEAKGLTERNNGYFETSFLPGRHFEGPADFNSQLQAWLQTANGRHSRRIECAPTARWTADRAAMLTLPPTPMDLGWHSRVRLPRDYYVRVASNDYSVDPAMIERLVTVNVSLDEVTVTYQGLPVARHDRAWGSGHTLTDPAHVEIAARLRRDFQHPPVTVLEEGLVRDLSVYDQAFGLAAADFDGQVA